MPRLSAKKSNLKYNSIRNTTLSIRIDTDIEQLLEQALELSHQDRAALVKFLIDSLHPEKEIKSEVAWSNELKERKKHLAEHQGGQQRNQISDQKIVVGNPAVRLKTGPDF